MSVPAAVRTMAVPTVMAQLIVLIYNMADTFFIGRTNDPLMVAGASLILPVFNISLSLAGLAGVGGGALVSRLFGRKETEEARRVFSFSVLLGTAAAALFSVLTLVFMSPLMRVLGADEGTFEYARNYAFCVIVCGAVPTVLSNILSTLMRSVGESKKAGFGIALGGVINIALDPLFMFVLLPDGCEIIGAGMATCLSNVISCVYFITVIVRLKDERVLRLTSPRDLPTKESIKSIFSVGVPSSIVTLLFDLDYVVIGRLMSSHGDVPLAAIGIVLKIERLPLNIGVGLCQGMIPIVAYNYAAKNYRRMTDVKNFTRLVGLICAAVSITLYLIFARQIMNVFISEAETVRVGTAFLRARCLATPFMFLCFFHVYLFNSFGCGTYALFLGVTRWLVLNIPMLFILNSALGMNGIVWAQATADFFTVIISLAVYRYYEKKHGLTPESSDGIKNEI